MLDTKAYNSREYTQPATHGPTEQKNPISLERELFTHITLGHLDPFWMTRTGIARVDLDIWKENKLPIAGITGIAEVIYGRIEDTDDAVSKIIADSGITMAIEDYRSYLVKNLIYIARLFPDVKLEWARVRKAFPAAKGIELNLNLDDTDTPDKYARSERDLFLLEA